MAHYLFALRLFAPDWKLIVIFLAMIGTSVAVGLAQAWPMAVLIDSVLTNTPRADLAHRMFLRLLPVSTPGRVVGVAAIGMGLKILQDALAGAKAMVNNRINNYGVMRARNLFYDGFDGSVEDADALYRLCNDAQGVQAVFNAFVGGCVSVVMIAAMAAIMWSKSAPLTVAAVGVSPLLAYINWRYGEAIRDRTAHAKRAEAEMLGRFSGADGGVFSASALYSARAWLGLNWEQEKYWFWVRTVFSVGGAVVFGYGGYLVWRDQFANPVAGGMTLGVLAVFMDYLGKMWEPLHRLIGLYAELQPAAAATERLLGAMRKEQTCRSTGR